MRGHWVVMGLGISGGYLGDIMGISGGYLGDTWGMSWVYSFVFYVLFVQIFPYNQVEKLSRCYTSIFADLVYSESYFIILNHFAAECLHERAIE